MHLLVVLATLLGVSCWASACDIRAKGISDEDKNTILKKHNDLRSKIANGKEEGFPSAADMLEMEWDDHLAVQAQVWAEKCEFEHDDPVDKIGMDAGQNIAWEGRSDKETDWDGMIQSFYDEVKDFNPKKIDKYDHDGEIGHFTQIIWAKSNKVGCGYIRYKVEDVNEFLYGCNYSPAGNTKTKPIYEVGTPCSKCGGCGSTPGLCKAGMMVLT